MPQRIAEYDVTRVLGQGGMGVVYEGHHRAIGKRVAIKVLRKEVSRDREAAERFAIEARAVNAVRHRGIVDIYGIGTLSDGRGYLLMELLEGRSLEQVLADEGRVATERAIDWAVQILEVLSAAHEAGVVHRDLKPSNLFLVERERYGTYLKLLDFGVAKLSGRSTLTCASAIVGTPDYMAPEQIRSEPITPAADLYALGCVLFELLTARRPFDGRTAVETMAMHLEAPAPRISHLVAGVPEVLDQLVAWMMEKDPASRPASADIALEYALAAREQYPLRRTPTPAPRRSAQLPTVSALPTWLECGADDPLEPTVLARPPLALTA